MQSVFVEDVNGPKDDSLGVLCRSYHGSASARSHVAEPLPADKEEKMIGQPQ